MYIDHVLEEKWRTQKLLAEDADYDINILMENIHSSIIKLESQLGLELKYSNRKGGYSNIDK